MTGRVNAKLYRIQEVITERFDSEVFIYQMIEEYLERTGKQFQQISLKEELNTESFRAMLFTYPSEQRKPYWRNFLESIVIDEDDLSDLETKSSSFILFIFNDTRVYAITKGYFGRFLLEKYMDNFFGLEVLSRLVDRNVTEIRKLEERGLFGSILGAEVFFREDYNLIYEDDFGKIYKAMLASIDEQHFERLGIVKKREDTKRVSISGGSSFEVSTNFDYDELINRVSRIEELLQTKGVNFNQFYRLTKSELEIIQDNLNQELIVMAYQSYIAGESVDFYHPDIFDYMKSVKVRFNVLGDYEEISYAQSMSFSEVIDLLVERDKIDSSNESSFIESLSNCYGEFTSNDDEFYSSQIGLDKWIGGEVEFDGKKYFKLDNHWYRYREGFNDYLNTYINDINFDLIKPTFKLREWDCSALSTEGSYNDSYKNTPNYVVSDTAFLYNLEICDLIRITDRTLYFYHVKKDLGRDLRVLENQIVNASRVLSNAIREDDNASLGLYYTAISNKKYNREELHFIDKNRVQQNITREDFFEMIRSKKIAFVFAYSSKSLLSEKEEVLATRSRIAKLSLLSCIKRMKQTEFDFFIERIIEV